MQLPKLSDRHLIILAILGFFAFYSVQLIPGFTEEIPSNPTEQVLSKQQALEIAREWQQENIPQMNAEGFVMLQTDKLLNSYLQKEKLMDEFSHTFSRHFSINYYQVEFSKGMASLLVNIHQHNGNVIGWQYSSVKTASDAQKTNEAHKPGMSDKDALPVLEAKLSQLNLDPARWQLSDKLTAPGQTTYIYQRDQFLGQAKLAVKATFAAKSLVTFQPVYEIPEAHQVWVENQDVKMEAMSLASLLINVIFVITAIILAVIYRGRITFSRGILMSLLYMTTATISTWNMYPAFRSMFAGQANAESLASFALVFQLLITLGTAILIYFAFVVGDAFWKKRELAIWPRWREPDKGFHVLAAMGRGYLFCLIILGIQQILFGIGYRFFDVWSVSDPLFSNYNLLYPMLFPLLAWAAAISEEAIYRLFGMALFKKLFRFTFLAALLSSMIWAFGHTAYPIYPAYTRFIEVTILGLIFCYIFVKYGLYTAIFAHAAVDCILMGVSIMFIDQAKHVLWGLFFIASPAVVGYLVYWTHSHLAWFRPKAPSESS